MEVGRKLVLCGSSIRHFPSFALRGMEENTLIRRRTSSRSLSSSGPQYLVVGLGNHSVPETRHSIGMTVINQLANKLDVRWQRNHKFSGFYGTTQVDQLDVILFKSKLAMNINGRSVFKVASSYKIQPSNILLIHDDLDKVLGKYCFKNGGSARGHNGVKSVISCFKSCDFKRLRVGIGRPDDRSQVINYVLQKFSDKEKDIAQNVVEECSDAVLQHLKDFTETDHS